ncbi:aldo-keto reductase MRA_2999-like [Sycon ciliatum]|uniref:aldo-keto reductase MRA_2999-like n=1 Tax=Sycon ciliatum TaxID=27933 RepID=UPI0031F63CF0
MPVIAIDQIGVGKAIAAAIAAGEVTREELFVVSKVGSGGLIPGAAMGYNDTMVQIGPILSSLQMKYVDLLLIHWPRPPGKSKDPAWQGQPATFNLSPANMESSAGHVQTR